MKVCVVGNGPSAKDRGEHIDACDKVVRIKAFWAFGTDNAGVKLSALAWYGCWIGWRGRPEHLLCEHWMTHAPCQIEAAKECGNRRLEHFAKQAAFWPVRLLTDEMWIRLRDYLDRHPSTGFVAVAMAIHLCDPTELVLYGFDSTTPERPNYHDAQETPLPDDIYAHDMLAEKRAIAEIGKGRWLGRPCGIKLIWPDMPELE